MNSLRIKELETLRRAVSLPITESEASNIIICHGEYGTGKSKLISQLVSELISKNCADMIFNFSGVDNLFYLPDVIGKLSVGFINPSNPNDKFSSPECNYNIRRQRELFALIEEHSEDLLQKIEKSSLLKSDSKYLLFKKQYPDYEQIPEQNIESIVEQKGDRRLLTQTGKVIAESFIVDLMNKFFPLNGENDSFEKYLETSEPVKIVIVFDNYDRYNYTINQWFAEEFVPYCTSKCFSDFVSYDISFLQPDVSVSHFFDIRLIFATRENPLLKPLYPAWQHYKKRLLDLPLQPLDISLLTEFLEKNRPELLEKSELIFKQTFGVPYLVEIWLELYALGEHEPNYTTLSQKASERIFECMAEQERDWLRCAAFLDAFSAQGLRCFSLINEHFLEACQYFHNAISLTEKLPDGIHLKLKESVKSFICESLAGESIQTWKELTAIANTYKEIYPLINKLTAKEVDVARSLAYFVSFDDNYALEKAFQTDIKLAKDFITQHPDWFCKNRITKSMRQDYRDKLLQFNKLVDLNKYPMKLEMLANIWSGFSEEMQTKIKSHSLTLDELVSENSTLDTELNASRTKCESLLLNIDEKENKTDELHKKIEEISHKRHLYSTISAFLVAIILWAFAEFIPDIFSDFYAIHNDLLNFIQSAVQIAAWLGAGVGLFFLALEIKLRLKHAELSELRKELSSIDDELSGMKKELNEESEKCIAIEKKLEEITTKTRLLQDEISILEDLLSEKYI